MRLGHALAWPRPVPWRADRGAKRGDQEVCGAAAPWLGARDCDAQGCRCGGQGPDAAAWVAYVFVLT